METVNPNVVLPASNKANEPSMGVFMLQSSVRPGPPPTQLVRCLGRDRVRAAGNSDRRLARDDARDSRAARVNRRNGAVVVLLVAAARTTAALALRAD